MKKAKESKTKKTKAKKRTARPTLTSTEYVKANAAALHKVAHSLWDQSGGGGGDGPAYFVVTAIEEIIDAHKGDITDYDGVFEEMRNSDKHPLVKLVWNKPKMR